MSVYDRPSLLKKILFAAWGMVTLILVFSVMLLINELVRQGHNPMELPTEVPRPASVSSIEKSTESREVTLYFASADGSKLEPETRLVAFGEATVENCRAVLEALVRGSMNNKPRILPPSVSVRALYLLRGGELVVDFADDLQMADSTSALSESLLVYGIVNSVSQPGVRGSDNQIVRSVRFLVGGEEPSGRFPGHVDFSQPFAPQPAWIQQADRRASANG
ncbi:MAG: hypothetical protein AMXMBFR84_39640 [Candidatus Hydrogenedentota bacterium]